MLISQLSIFLQNKKGRFAEVAKILGEKSINIVAFDIAGTAEAYGILRLIVNKADLAIDELRHANITATESEVLCVKLPNEPMALAKMLKTISEKGVNVEYMYAGAESVIILAPSNIERAKDVMKEEGYALQTSSDLI